MATSAPARPAAPPAELLIDRYLPRYDVGLIEHTVAEADLATTWEALCELDLAQVHTPLMDAAMYVRGLPTRVAAQFGRGAPPEAPARLPLGGGGPPMQGWLSLGEVAEHEIALGAVGRFWQPDIQWYDVTGMTPEAFAAFTEPGWGRIAANFTVLAYTPTEDAGVLRGPHRDRGPGLGAPLRPLLDGHPAVRRAHHARGAHRGPRGRAAALRSLIGNERSTGPARNPSGARPRSRPGGWSATTTLTPSPPRATWPRPCGRWASWTGARQLQEDVLARCRRVLGDDHPTRPHPHRPGPSADTLRELGELDRTGPADPSETGP